MANGRGRPWVAVSGVAAVIAAVIIACQFAPDPYAPKRLSDDVSVTGQITTAQVPAMQAKGFRTIVNMRIDDEAPGQPNYAEMMKAVQDARLGYGYVPLVLPIFGLLWLRHWNKRAKTQAATVPAAGDAAHVGARDHGEGTS